MTQSLRFGFLLCSFFLFVSVSEANQYVWSKSKSIELKTFVDGYNTLVTIFAEIDDPESSAELDSLIVRYGNTEVSVPGEILALAPRPILESLRVSYLSRYSEVILESVSDAQVTRIARDANDESPNITVDISFVEAEEILVDRHELPRISIDISGDRVAGFSIWRFDGTDWVRQTDEELGHFGLY